MPMFKFFAMHTATLHWLNLLKPNNKYISSCPILTSSERTKDVQCQLTLHKIRVCLTTLPNGCPLGELCDIAQWLSVGWCFLTSPLKEVSNAPPLRQWVTKAPLGLVWEYGIRRLVTYRGWQGGLSVLLWIWRNQHWGWHHWCHRDWLALHQGYSRTIFGGRKWWYAWWKLSNIVQCQSLHAPPSSREKVEHKNQQTLKDIQSHPRKKE